MFFQLLYIHLFRPFLKYNQANSPLPAHVSPRKMCTHAAATISKLLRLYKRTYGLRQICNIAVYIAHSACTIHLLNLPEKNARRDVIHGVRQLEEIAESWLCARRTLCILSVQVRKWKIELPEEATEVLARTDAKFGSPTAFDRNSPVSDTTSPMVRRQTSSPPISKQETPFPVPKHGVSNLSAVSNLKLPRGSPSNLPQSRAVPLPPTSKYSSPSQQPTFLPPQPQKAQWPQNRPPADSTPQAHTSPSALFGGADTLVDSRDWWLRDQSALYEAWPKQESGAMFMGNGLGNAIGNPANGLLPDSGIDGMGVIDDPNGNGTEGIGYLPFDANAYGFNNGDVYHS